MARWKGEGGGGGDEGSDSGDRGSEDVFRVTRTKGLDRDRWGWGRIMTMARWKGGG